MTIDVRYTSGVKPYMLNVRYWPYDGGSVCVTRNCGMEGEVTVDGAKYKILVLNESCDGRFDDLKNDALLIDASEAGDFRLYPAASMRICSFYIPLNRPFKLGDVTLQGAGDVAGRNAAHPCAV